MSKESVARLREAILAKRGAVGLKRERVEFCGQEVWAWELTGKQRAIVEQARQKVDGKKQTVTVDLELERAMVVCMGVKDSGGDGAKRIFNVGDEVYVNQLPASELDVPYEAIVRLSGMTPTAREDAKKNSAATPCDDDSTDSPTDAAGPQSNGVLQGSGAAS